jgi:hypothetical protein
MDTPARVPVPTKSARTPARAGAKEYARFIRYTGGDASSFGTLMQQISAKNYAGKRVRFRALVKTRDVSNWAGLWMSALRVPQEPPERVLQQPGQADHRHHRLAATQRHAGHSGRRDRAELRRD